MTDWTAAYETDFTAGGGTGDRPIVVSYASSPPADVVFSSPKRDTPRVGVVPSTCFVQYEFAGVLDSRGGQWRSVSRMARETRSDQRGSQQ